MQTSSDDEIVVLDVPPQADFSKGVGRNLGKRSRKLHVSPAGKKVLRSTVKPSPCKKQRFIEIIEISDSEDDSAQDLRNRREVSRVGPNAKAGPSSQINCSQGSQSRLPLFLDSDSDSDEHDPFIQKIREEQERENQERLQRAAKLNPRQLKSDAALARKLAAQDEKEYKKVLEKIQKKSEGIVFRITVDVESKLLECGTPAHEDDLARFELWKQRLANAFLKVKKFHWIVNYELEKKFEEARETLRGVMGGEEPKELQMFHGTQTQNIDLILSGGFRIGGVGGHRIVNGTGQGYGVYLAEDATLALGHSAGANRMFACRVLPGRSTPDIHYSMTVPQEAVGSGQYESYSCPGVLVVRHTALVLPCYMIEWDNYYGVPGGVGALGYGAAAPAFPYYMAPVPPLLGRAAPAARVAAPKHTTKKRK